MPEELPVAESIKKIETKQRKQLGKAGDARKRERRVIAQGPASGFPQFPSHEFQCAKADWSSEMQTVTARRSRGPSARRAREPRGPPLPSGEG